MTYKKDVSPFQELSLQGASPEAAPESAQSQQATTAIIYLSFVNVICWKFIDLFKSSNLYIYSQ